VELYFHSLNTSSRRDAELNTWTILPLPLKIIKRCNTFYKTRLDIAQAVKLLAYRLDDWCSVLGRSRKDFPRHHVGTSQLSVQWLRG
jgi:hypothetical protein